MISADGWFDWMIRDPGPDWKVNGGKNPAVGCVPHSAEGYWPYLQTLLWTTRRASWFASNLQDGRCYQHYPITAQTWTSGAAFPNNNFVAWENEGVAGQPLTDEQVANCIRIIDEISTLKIWTPMRPLTNTNVTATLYEHRECTRWGAEPTACPSGRIPWGRIMAGLEDAMTVDEKAQLDAVERLVKELAKQQFELAVDQNKRLVAIEDKLGIPHQ